MKQILIAALAIVMISCNSQKNTKTANDNNHKVVVDSVLQSSGYTYLKFNEGGNEQWLATTGMDAKVGDVFYFEKSMVMPDFHSKELNRTFATILFVDKLTTEPVSAEKKAPAVSPGSSKAKPAKQDIQIEKAKDGISIAELFSNKESYSNKTVKIKGQVVKYSSEIMNKNWFHLQDGTESNGMFDLTVTTMAELKAGDIVTVEGKISLNKDFGYGYVYDVILEDAVLK